MARPYESRLTGAGASLALAAIAVVVYANALGNGFVLDDPGIILRNPLVQEPGSSWRAFAQPYWPAEVGSGQYRPLGILAFALDRAIAGNNATWFHGVNLAWHALVVVLVHRLALSSLAPTGAAVAALLFAVHPVHVEAVSNVVGRLELMAAAFGIAALLLHRRGSLVALPAYAAALCSKESAIMVPVLAALADVVPATPTPRLRRKALYAGYAVVSVAWGALMLRALNGAPVTVTSAVFLDQDAFTRVLTVLSIVPHYVRLLLVPMHLSSDYEPDVIVPVSGLTPHAMLGLLLVVAHLTVVVRMWRRSPALAYGLAWIPLALAPVSNILFATGVALAERTLYLPSVGLAIVVGWVADQVRAPQRALAVSAFSAATLGMIAVTWSRTPVWRDARSYAMSLIEQHPESYRGPWVAGRTLRAANQVAAADREFALARRIYGRDVSLLRESGSLALQLGRHDEARQLNDSATAIEVRRRQR
jgi:hypothetical protein